jgi:DNA-binding transcriptional LysR family regulator
MRPISWHQLEYFLAVSRTQHISRAAGEVGLSQPALSRAIATLEANLEVPLFDRVGRSIVLTPLGEIFRRRVERAVHEIDDARAELADLASAERGTVKIGFLRTLGIDYLPNLVRRYKAIFPRAQFTFAQNNSVELERNLLEGQLDMIFVSRGRPEIKWSLVEEQELILIVPPSHSLARSRTAALRDLRSENFVSLKNGYRFRDITEGFCHRAGFTPKYSFEGEDFSSVIGFVASGFGIAIVVPEYALSPRVASLRLVDPVPKRAFGIGWLTNRFLSASACSFRDFVLAHEVQQGENSTTLAPG